MDFSAWKRWRICMVQSKNEVKILFDRDFLHHPFFDFLSADEKKMTEDRIAQGKTIIAGVFKNGRHIFNASFDIDHRDLLHCRDVGGNFGRNLDDLHRVAFIIAKGLKKDFITVNATKRAVKKFCTRLGYEHVQDNEFQKVVN